MRHTEALTATAAPVAPDMQRTVGVSAGTAAVLGLHRLRQADAPTTAYLMIGDRCTYDCAFCAQARRSAARAHFLSRVVWPPYPLNTVLLAVARAFERQGIERCCLQVTASADHFRRTLKLIRQLRTLSAIPISTCIVLSELDQVRVLLESGADRVTLALDAACERAHRDAKGSGWQRCLDLLGQAAARFAGHVGTHLIAGLGETEREMALMVQEMIDRQVSVGLFSFTPVTGTLWENRAPPSLPSYRRIQAARYLITRGLCRVEDFEFSPSGQIICYGLSKDRLWDSLRDGRPFETAGCPGCNRPYYNERPGRVMYNYPRPLTAGEAAAAMHSAIAGLALHSCADQSEPQAAAVVADGRRR